MREDYLAERRLCYRISELRPERTTLVFLHGLSGSLSAWVPFETYFEASFNVITLDLRGHGKTRRWRRYEDYHLRFFADDVGALLAHLRVREHVLIGHSFGTLVVLELIKRGSSAERAILMSPNYAVHKMLRSRITRGILGVFMRLFSHLPSIHFIGEHIDYSWLGYSKDWDIRRLYADIRNTGVRTYLYCLHHVYAFIKDEEWKRITVPTLIVHGEYDTFVPASHARDLARILPNAELVILPSANHMLVLNNVNEVIRAVDAFAIR